MKIIITESQLKVITENSYMGKYEGDMIDVGHFSGRKIPKPVLVNVLKVISKTIGEDVTSSKFRRGQYDDTEIPIFGQLMAFLTGTF